MHSQHCLLAVPVTPKHPDKQNPTQVGEYLACPGLESWESRQALKIQERYRLVVWVGVIGGYKHVISELGKGKPILRAKKGRRVVRDLQHPPPSKIITVLPHPSMGVELSTLHPKILPWRYW